MEIVTDFIFLGSKITADGNCSHEIKRCSLFGSIFASKDDQYASYDQLDSLLKRIDNILLKVCLVKAMVFPVVMYGCESWTMKKAEHQRIDALNCGVGRDSWESFGQWGDPTSQS